MSCGGEFTNSKVTVHPVVEAPGWTNKLLFLPRKIAIIWDFVMSEFSHFQASVIFSHEAARELPSELSVGMGSWGGGDGPSWVLWSRRGCALYPWERGTFWEWGVALAGDKAQEGVVRAVVRTWGGRGRFYDAFCQFRGVSESQQQLHPAQVSCSNVSITT